VNGVVQPHRQRLSVEYLQFFLGSASAVRLLQRHAGQRLPTRDQFFRALRRQAIIASYLTRGYPLPMLAAKYGLSVSAVEKIVYRHIRRMRKLGLPAVPRERRRRGRRRRNTLLADAGSGCHR
jgi:hypothetical protein